MTQWLCGSAQTRRLIGGDTGVHILRCTPTPRRQVPLLPSRLRTKNTVAATSVATTWKGIFGVSAAMTAGEGCWLFPQDQRPVTGR